MHQMKVLTPTTVATEEGTAPRVPLLKLTIESLSKQVTSHQKVGIGIVLWYVLGPALASLFWVSVDFPELFLKTSELFLNSLRPVEKGQEHPRAIPKNIGKF